MHQKTLRLVWLIILAITVRAASAQDAPMGDDEQIAAQIQKTIEDANAGNAVAQVRVGRLYLSGFGVEKDQAAAVSWFQKAADQGDAEGQMYLGYAYESGTGVQEDQTAAAKWYKKSAEQGNAMGEAAYGRALSGGKGVPQDEAGAVQWFAKSAEQGNPYGQRSLGSMYENGRGVARDPVKAMMYFKMAANRGDAFAQYIVGERYAKGRGVAKDDAAALRWFQKSADGGDPAGQAELGYRYITGDSVTKDEDAGLDLYKKAAAQNPTNTDTVLRIVKEFKKVGMVNDARTVFLGEYEMYKKRIAEDPNDYSAMNEVAWLCAGCDENLEEGLAMAKAAVKGVPDDPGKMDTLAEVNFHLKNYDEAIRIETEVCRQMPDDNFMKEQLERFKAGKQSPATQPEK